MAHTATGQSPISHLQSPIRPGGAVLGLAADAGGAIWLATESGLWWGGPGAWRPLEPPTPLPLVTTIIALPSERNDGPPLLLAGGAPVGIAYSLDGGGSWHAAHTDAVEAPITCFVASPRFATDRVLLAGTDGAGILRSTDGGRSWRLSNAGLQEFSVLALAAAPVWGEHEVVFALTTGGLYRSPNGGRYWQRNADCGEQLPLQALAVSPAFADDGAVYAGGEMAGIVRSTDGGRSWKPVAPRGDVVPAGINCLWLSPADKSELFAGTLDGAIFRSADGGASWCSVAAGHGPVLAFAASTTTLVAGLFAEGLLVSSYGGAQWHNDESLAVRDITRLARAADGALLAFGPSGGVWRASNAGWQPLLAGLPGLSLTTLLALPDGKILLGTTSGLILLLPNGEQRMIELPTSAAATALAFDGAAIWLGDAAGALWRAASDLAQWDLVATLAAGQPVMALAADQRALVAATADGQTRRATLWRSTDGGASWARWLDDTPGQARVSLCPGEPDWATIGSRIWRWDNTTWRSSELDGHPIVAVQRVPGSETIVAATSVRVFRCNDNETWAPVDVTLLPGGLLDLAVLPSGQFIGLGRGGYIVVA